MFITTDDGQKKVGTFILNKGQLKYKASKEYEPMMREIMNGPTGKDLSKWLKSLPTIYSGSALRAEYGATNDSETADRGKEAARKISRFKV